MAVFLFRRWANVFQVSVISLKFLHSTLCPLQAQVNWCC